MTITWKYYYDYTLHIHRNNSYKIHTHLHGKDMDYINIINQLCIIKPQKNKNNTWNGIENVLLVLQSNCSNQTNNIKNQRWDHNDTHEGITRKRCTGCANSDVPLEMVLTHRDLFLWYLKYGPEVIDPNTRYHYSITVCWGNKLIIRKKEGNLTSKTYWEPLKSRLDQRSYPGSSPQKNLHNWKWLKKEKKFQSQDLNTYPQRID